MGNENGENLIKATSGGLNGTLRVMAWGCSVDEVGDFPPTVVRGTGAMLRPAHAGDGEVPVFLPLSRPEARTIGGHLYERANVFVELLGGPNPRSFWAVADALVRAVARAGLEGTPVDALAARLGQAMAHGPQVAEATRDELRDWAETEAARRTVAATDAAWNDGRPTPTDEQIARGPLAERVVEAMQTLIDEANDGGELRMHVETLANRANLGIARTRRVLEALVACRHVVCSGEPSLVSSWRIADEAKPSAPGDRVAAAMLERPQVRGLLDYMAREIADAGGELRRKMGPIADANGMTTNVARDILGVLVDLGYLERENDGAGRPFVWRMGPRLPTTSPTETRAGAAPAVAEDVPPDRLTRMLALVVEFTPGLTGHIFSDEAKREHRAASALAREVVERWTPAQRVEAAAWATAEHVSASDNPDVKRLPKPLHVTGLEAMLRDRPRGGIWASATPRPDGGVDVVTSLDGEAGASGEAPAPPSHDTGDVVSGASAAAACHALAESRRLGRIQGTDAIVAVPIADAEPRLQRVRPLVGAAAEHTHVAKFTTHDGIVYAAYMRVPHAGLHQIVGFERLGVACDGAP